MIQRVKKGFKKRVSAIFDTRIYKNNKTVSCQKNADIAVVLHLFYPEMWAYFENELRNLGEYDLFITVPLSKKELVPQGLTNKGTVFYVPNRGRDVLPFLYVIKRIHPMGYRAILKLHSKKSPHYKEGDIWLNSMVRSLTNAKTKVIKELFQNQETIVGPAGHFTSLEVNFEANGKKLEKILFRSTTKGRVQRMTQRDRAKHGFFAGTMFWISPGLAADAVYNVPLHRFDVEGGQIDGTYAHAIERAFCLLPQLRGEKLYEVNEKGTIIEVDVSSGAIPEWSDKYSGK